jgi:hypothetical protein
LYFEFWSIKLIWKCVLFKLNSLPSVFIIIRPLRFHFFLVFRPSIQRRQDYLEEKESETKIIKRNFSRYFHFIFLPQVQGCKYFFHICESLFLLTTHNGEGITLFFPSIELWSWSPIYPQSISGLGANVNHPHTHKVHHPILQDFSTSNSARYKNETLLLKHLQSLLLYSNFFFTLHLLKYFSTEENCDLVD